MASIIITEKKGEGLRAVYFMQVEKCVQSREESPSWNSSKNEEEIPLGREPLNLRRFGTPLRFYPSPQNTYIHTNLHRSSELQTHKIPFMDSSVMNNNGDHIMPVPRLTTSHRFSFILKKP